MDISHPANSIHFKSVHSNSHNNLYNAPVICATMPSFILTSGLNLVNSAQANSNSSVNNQESSSLNALATNSLTSLSAAQLVPMISNGSRSSNLQQIPVQQQTLTPDHCNNKTTHNNHLKTASPLSQIQMTSAPAIHNNIDFNNINNTNNITSNDSETHSSNTGVHQYHHNHHHGARATPVNSNMLNSMQPKSVNKSDATIRNDINMSIPKSGIPSIASIEQYQLKGTTNSIDYVYLAKASCSGSSRSCHNVPTVQIISSACSSFPTDFDDNPMDNNEGKGFKCRVCDRHFKQKGNLKTHLMTHSGERPHECPTCGKIFTQKGNLDTHVKIHTETKDHKCSFCDRGFTQRGNLKTHIRSVHTKEKPYACGVCGKAFSQKGNMLTHFRTHDKNARFPCNVCGKTFSQKGNLKTHQQRHGRRPGR